MKKFVILAGGAMIAACTPVKERALEECLEQAKAITLPGGVDGQQVCECVTKDIADDASVDDANKAMSANMMSCAKEAAADIMSQKAKGNTAEKTAE